MRKRDREALVAIIESATGGTVVHLNDGESHRRMLVYNRACLRAERRSWRNQPSCPTRTKTPKRGREGDAE